MSSVNTGSTFSARGAVALVTGANRGIGKVFARELIDRGAARVYGGARNPDRIDVPGVVPIRLDITDPAQVAAAAEQCTNLTLLVNNAGIFRAADIEYPKLPPRDLVTTTLDALEMGEIELLADQFTRQTKAILSDYPCKRPPF